MASDYPTQSNSNSTALHFFHVFVRHSNCVKVSIIILYQHVYFLHDIIARFALNKIAFFQFIVIIAQCRISLKSFLMIIFASSASWRRLVEPSPRLRKENASGQEVRQTPQVINRVGIRTIVVDVIKPMSAIAATVKFDNGLRTPENTTGVMTSFRRQIFIPVSFGRLERDMAGTTKSLPSIICVVICSVKGT